MQKGQGVKGKVVKRTPWKFHQGYHLRYQHHLEWLKWCLEGLHLWVTKKKKVTQHHHLEDQSLFLFFWFKKINEFDYLGFLRTLFCKVSFILKDITFVWNVAFDLFFVSLKNFYLLLRGQGWNLSFLKCFYFFPR